MKNSGGTLSDILFELQKLQLGSLETDYEEARIAKMRAGMALDKAHYEILASHAGIDEHVAGSRAILETMELREAFVAARDHFEMCKNELRDFRAHCNARRFDQDWVQSIKAAAQREKAERPAMIEPEGETE